MSVGMAMVNELLGSACLGFAIWATLVGGVYPAIVALDYAVAALNFFAGAAQLADR